jgi:alpha-tubulin suppressor-like RCC1 family protein
MKNLTHKILIVLLALLISQNSSAQGAQTLWAWGYNGLGQLGLGNKTDYSTPQQVGTDTNWASIDAANVFNAGIRKDGSLWTWGNNGFGELGLGYVGGQTTPQRVGTDTNWLFVACGNEHTAVIKKNGELYTCGRNRFGQLGLGNTRNYYTPQKVGSDSNWIIVQTNGSTTVALRNNGTLWAWGLNYYGQLGLGNTTDYSTPQQVGTDTNWVSIYTGGYHSLGLKEDGTLWTWGTNYYGQLGLGNKTNYYTPQQVGTDTNWASIEDGINSMAGILKDGTLWTWGNNSYGQLGLGNTTDYSTPQQVGTDTNWVLVKISGGHSFGIKRDGTLWAWGRNNYGQLGLGNKTDYNTPQQVGTDTNWASIDAESGHTLALKKSLNTEPPLWKGSGNISNSINWSTGKVPITTDSAIILSGTMNVNQATTLDAMKVNNGATVKLTAPLTVRNLHLNDGIIDLNGQRLTITGGIYQSKDSANYYIQAGTSASPKPNSELVFAPTANTSSTLYFNPNANTLKVLELGTSSKTAQVTLGNALKIKGGKTPSNVGSLKVNNGSKLIIPNGASLTLKSDTFNAYLNLAAPAQRAIHCQGTGTFNIERQHYGARGWRLYSHPFSADINLTQIADDIELIGSGGTSEGFYSDAYTNNAAFWYDYSKADTTATTDLAWTGFSSAKGTLISGNANKWKKNSPIIVFNPGAVRGSGAFSNPTLATYQEGKITLSYTLDSTTVHLNDGKTQTISTADLTSAPKSRYFFLINPFTAPVRLSRIQGLNLTNCANKFYYWKQNQASISSNFMPAAWASEALFNGNATRDSNISIPAFGTILIEMRNPSSATTFTIPESAKQLTNFNYMVGGDLSSSGSGVKQTLFMELPQPYQGPGAIEVQLLMNDSVPVDRMLIYDRAGESTSFTNNDAKKFKEPSFSNIYSLSLSGELLSLDAQDITARLASGEEQVEIPLVIDRDFNKTQKNLRLRIGEKHSDLECYFKDAKTGILTTAESFSDLPLEFLQSEVSIHRYSLVFKRNSSSTEDIHKNTETHVSNKPQLLAYPNPVEDKLHIRLLNHNGKVPYSIYSIAGKKILEGTIQNLEIIKTKQLQAGIYIIEANGEKVKFVKE